MAKSIYGYKDVFSPEHIYMTPKDRAAFKFLIENENYNTCKAGRDFYSIERKTKTELIKEYSERVNELKNSHATSKIAKLTFAVNASMYEEKVGILKESPHNDFVCFESHVLFKAN